VALDKKHKAFRYPKLMPIDANNVILEQAFARFLVLVRTKGQPITSSTKPTLHPEDLVELIGDDADHFEGISDSPQRRRLVENWIASDFATCIREGMGRHSGAARIANLHPLHMSTIKLLDPRIRSQDRDVSVFLYNAFRDSGLVIGEQATFLPFLTKGTVDFGEHDAKFDEKTADGLDIQTLFLLRLLEHFKMDKSDKRKQVVPHDFLCPAQKQLLVNDTARLLVYRDIIPRREMIDYLTTLFAFHSALYCMKTFSLVNAIVDTKKVRCSRCKTIKAEPLSDLAECEHRPVIFVDLTDGSDAACDALAKQSVAANYASMYRYFRAHYKLKKLDEFASTFPGYTGSVEELTKFMGHRDLDGFFRVKLEDITAIEEGEEQDPQVKAILDLNLPPLESYVEILYQKTFETRVRNHRGLMASLCGLNRDDGFLHGGRGQKRKYVLGNQLLELLVQLAVVDARKGQFCTKTITISEFVNWLRVRYGILIDATSGPNDDPEIAQALEVNYAALKARLRKLGFFTDLSDASISQVIRPRFPIEAPSPAKGFSNR
jgi:hypothetical protein